MNLALGSPTAFLAELKNSALNGNNEGFIEKNYISPLIQAAPPPLLLKQISYIYFT